MNCLTKRMLRGRDCLMLLLTAAAGMVGGSAAVVYDNVTTPLVDTNGVQIAHFSSRQFGDEVILAGRDRLVTDFLFEYFGDFTQSLSEYARIRFYKNDGPGRYPAPGTVLYDSGNFRLQEGYNTKWISDLSVVVPDSFTFSIEFAGLTGEPGNRAGLLIYHPPALGSSYRDFWELINGTWTLSHFGGTSFKPEANFAVRIVAVPEASALALLGLGGAVLLARRRGP